MTNFSKKKIISQKSSSSSGGGGITSVVGGTNITIDNTDPSNPIINGVAASSIIVVANYSALPAPNTVTGKFYWCSASQGTSWLPGSLGGTYYNSGMYYSNGTTWEWLNVPYNATQAEVHTGVDNTKFVTPSTFAGEKNVTDGIVGLTGFNHNFKNTAGTFLSYFTNSNTASRTYTFQDAAGTVAFLSDITGSGTTELAAVISQTNTPAGSPTTGDRYLVGTVPTGAWVGNANNIAEWNGLSWTYTTPVLNNTVFVTATLTTLRYSGSSWIAYQGTAVLQNGNTLGTSLNIGTNDAQSVITKVNGITRNTNSTTISTYQIGTTSTNAMYRLDSIGFRIGTVADIATANTVPFQIGNLTTGTGSNAQILIQPHSTSDKNLSIGRYSTVADSCVIHYQSGPSTTNYSIFLDHLSTILNATAVVGLLINDVVKVNVRTDRVNFIIPSCHGATATLNTTPTSYIDIIGTNGYDQLRLRTQYTPASSASATGQTGDIAVDDNYIYFKASTGWKRTALSTF